MDDVSPGELPELQNAVLGDDDLSALFRDYRACATNFEIVIKAGRGQVQQGSTPTLDQAEQLITSRTVQGVQIRYDFKAGKWCDTLMPNAKGVRLVRIRQSPP